MPAILRRYGIHARWHFWRHTPFKENALATLVRDCPVLFVISSIVKPGSGLHWISAWGYDDATDEFLCYDSKAPETRDASGNARYSTSLLLSRLPWWGTFALTIEGETP